VTRSKARNLLYDRELRRFDLGQLDEKVRNAMKSPLFQKQGDLFAMEIENPLVLDHLRSKLQTLGYASDSSFSPSLVKMSLDAVAALIESFHPGKEGESLRKALVKYGAPDTSFKGVLKEVLKKVASKVANDTGKALVSQYLGPLVDGAVDKCKETVGQLIKESRDATTQD